LEEAHIADHADRVMRFPVGLVLEKLGVRARLQGHRYWAEHCPLPSHGPPNQAHRWQNFFVRDETRDRPGQFHCFSCKGGGGLADLVAELRGIERPDAAQWLRDLASQAPDMTTGIRVRFENSIGPRVLRMPEGVEQVPFGRWNGVAQAYARARGIEPWQVARWRIGVATCGRLEGRIVIPIYDAGGRLLDYAARTYVGDPKRYLMAAEEEGPTRGALFGEQHWKPGFPLVVFEGAINGLAVERVAPDVVSLAGLSGSSVAARHLMRLAGAKRVIMATDPDRAGAAAMAAVVHGLRGVAGMQVARVRIPAGMDAAEMPAEELRAELQRCLREVGI
jgi:DNA primase